MVVSDLGYCFAFTAIGFLIGYWLELELGA